MSIRLSITACCLMLVSQGLSAAPGLPELLGGSSGQNTVSFSDDADARFVTFCPETDCLTFSVPQTSPQAVLSDFVLIYVFHTTTSPSLRTFVTTSGKAPVAAAIERNRASCREKDELRLASCVLQGLASRYEVSAESLGTSGSTTKPVPISLSRTTDAGALQAVRETRASAWGK